MATIRTYELSRKRSVNPVLLCRVQRFPHDVCAILRYHFADGSFSVKFPSSWVAPAIADELRRFIEFVNSPRWLESVQAFEHPSDSLFNEDLF